MRQIGRKNKERDARMIRALLEGAPSVAAAAACAEFDPGQTVIVAKSGGDYTSIQAAIDSITTASEVEPWAAIVYPGVYTEDLALKAWVTVVGVGREAVVISGAAGAGSPQIIVAGAGYAAIGNVTIRKEVAINDFDLTGVLAPAAGEMVVNNVRVTLTTAVVTGAILKAFAGNGNGGVVHTFDSWPSATLDSGATGVAYGAYVPDSGGDLIFYHCTPIVGTTYDLYNLA